MIIEILSQTYKCGCNRGMAAKEIPQLLTKFNSIIEWELCKWPEMRIEGAEPEITMDDSGNEVKTYPTEINKEFLGEDPELKPGNMFLYEGNVIAVDSSDRLVLIVSESGHGALERLWDERIGAEIDLFLNNENTLEDVSEEIVTPDQIPTEGYEKFNPPYASYRIWRERGGLNKYIPPHKICLKVEFMCEYLLKPTTVYMTDWSIWFNMKDIDQDLYSILSNELLAWFFENSSREDITTK